MIEVVPLTSDLVQAIHQSMLRQHGGLAGIRDPGALESAIARAENYLAYRNETTIAEMAAAISYGITRNHPFIDGNKRVALMSIYVFMGLNGFHLKASEEDAFLIILGVARGDIDEATLASWITRSVVTFT